MEQNPKTAKKTTWECVLSSEEKDYIIKAALFNDYSSRHDYSEISIDRDSPLLNALLKGDIGNAMKQSVVRLANYKVFKQNHDVPLMDEGLVQDIADGEECIHCTEPEFTRTPPAPDEFTHWDGDGTERFDYGT